VVGDVGVDAAVAEGGELFAAEHHVDAEAWEAAVVGGAEAGALVTVGVVEVVGDLAVEPRGGYVVHVACEDEWDTAVAHQRAEVVEPLLFVLEDGLLAFAECVTRGGVEFPMAQLVDVLALVEAEGVAVHVHAAEAEAAVVFHELDEDFLLVNAFDVGDGELGEDHGAGGFALAAARAVEVVVAHDGEAVGDVQPFDGDILLQAEEVGLLFTDEVEEEQGVGVFGCRLEAVAAEVVEVIAEEADQVRVLLARGYLGGATNLEEEAYVGEAYEDGAGGDEEFPAAHEEPYEGQHDVEQQHGKEAVGEDGRQDAGGRGDGAGKGGGYQPQCGDNIEY